MRSHVICMVLASVLDWSLCGAPASPEERLPDAIGRIQNSVVKITVTGKPVGRDNEVYEGTGFMVGSRGMIITVLHVVKKPDYWEADENNQPKRKIEVQIPNDHGVVGTRVEAQFIDFLENKDAARLKINGANYKEVVCGGFEPALLTKKYFRLGYNKGETNLNVDLGERLPTQDRLAPRYTFKIRSQFGLSGGPVVTDSGRVIGFVT